MITAAIGIPLLLLLLWLGGWWLGAALALLAGIGCREYTLLVRAMGRRPSLLTYAAGYLYILIGFLCFFFTQQLGGALWLLIIIWTTDTAAYEIGRRIGKTKLAPAVSPHKTVEGAVAGLIGALLLGGGYGLLFMDINWISALIAPLRSLSRASVRVRSVSMGLIPRARGTGAGSRASIPHAAGSRRKTREQPLPREMRLNQQEDYLLFAFVLIVLASWVNCSSVLLSSLSEVCKSFDCSFSPSSSA